MTLHRSWAWQKITNAIKEKACISEVDLGCIVKLDQQINSKISWYFLDYLCRGAQGGGSLGQPREAPIELRRPRLKGQF